MDQPDFVAVHPDYGACAIEVKDWAPDIYRPSPTGWVEVLTGGHWQRIKDAPLVQAHRYRTTIFDGFFADTETESSHFRLVRAAVVLPRYRNRQAHALLGQTPMDPETRKSSRFGEQMPSQTRTPSSGWWPAGGTERLVTCLRSVSPGS
jgi:hypothetical protein